MVAVIGNNKNKMMSVSVNRLTAPGRGAVAVVRFHTDAPREAQILDQHFRSASNRKTSSVETGRILYGHWGAEDVVVVRTAENEWEINCHGGEAAVGRIVTDLGGKSDSNVQSRLDDALLTELLKCRTRQTANYILCQQQGVLTAFLQRLMNLTTAEDACHAVQDVLKWESFASHLSTPWKVAVVGRPNAGKSSLLNAILGYERSIVFDQPGTTRDRIEAEVFVDGWPFVLIDTAGVRDDVSDDIEVIGVQAARSSMADSDACLFVVDSTVGWTQLDRQLLAEVAPLKPTIVLWNKADLSSSAELSETCEIHVLQTSAITQDGLPDLLSWLSETLIPEVPSTEQPLPVVPALTTELQAFTKKSDLSRFKLLLEKWLS